MLIVSLNFRKVPMSVYREQLSKGAELPPIESIVFDRAWPAGAAW